MSIATIQFNSKTLAREVTYSAILPDKGNGPYPILMQLHGAGQSHTAWLYQSRLPAYITDIPMIVILPDGELSYYLNNGSEQRYEEFLMQDVWQHVQHIFPVRPGRWGIGGFSMGGYGAMRLGCKYPERFASIWAHAGWYPTRTQIQHSSYLNRHEEGHNDADIYWQSEQLVQKLHQVAIGFDCGLDDFNLECNRNFHQHLEHLGLEHTYTEDVGNHNWDFCDQHLRQALTHHSTILGIS